MEKRGLSAIQLKYIAIISMVIDHVAWGFVDFYSPLGQVLHVMGRLTIPIMAFFVAEGLKKTSDRRRYLFRMFGFYLISIVPFYLFFSFEYDYRQNYLFDLFLAMAAVVTIDSKRLKTWAKVLLVTLICGISFGVGGWPILPIALVCIFYYADTFKKKCIFTVIAVCFIEVFLMGAIYLNQQIHFMSYDWIWYEKLYFLGFLLALPLLRLYNGQKGKVSLGRYFFYLFYPCHFAVLYAIQELIKLGNPSQAWYLGLQLVAVAIIFFVVVAMFRATPSRAQAGGTLLTVSALVYVVGFFIETVETDLSAVYIGVIIEYIGEASLIVGITWFFSEFCRIGINRIVYYVEIAFGIAVVYLVATARSNHFFYADISLEMSKFNFQHLKLEYGPGFFVFISVFAGVCIALIYALQRVYMKGTAIEKKRVRLMYAAIACPWIAVLINYSGLTGGYEITPLGVVASGSCSMLAFFKYRYFDSVNLARENIMYHSDEGFIVADPKYTIVYYNKIAREMFAGIVAGMSLKDNLDLGRLLSKPKYTKVINSKTYELYLEPIEENGEIQAYAVRVSDMTEHYEYVEKLKRMADTDSLTGLNNRSSMKKQINDFALGGGKGAFFMFDLDKFKDINDTYGHEIGDIVLLGMAKAMKSIAAEADVTCRIGGDEFCMLIKNITDEHVLREKAEGIAAKLSGMINNQLDIDITMSSGGIIFSNISADKIDDVFSEFYRQGDAVLYEAKRNGRNRCEIKKMRE